MKTIKSAIYKKMFKNHWAEGFQLDFPTSGHTLRVHFRKPGMDPHFYFGILSSFVNTVLICNLQRVHHIG